MSGKIPVLPQIQDFQRFGNAQMSVGICWAILGLCRDSGKENGNYCHYRGYIGGI